MKKETKKIRKIENKKKLFEMWTEIFPSFIIRFFIFINFYKKIITNTPPSQDSERFFIISHTFNIDFFWLFIVLVQSTTDFFFNLSSGSPSSSTSWGLIIARRKMTVAGIFFKKTLILII